MPMETHISPRASLLIYRKAGTPFLASKRVPTICFKGIAQALATGITEHRLASICVGKQPSEIVALFLLTLLMIIGPLAIQHFNDLPMRGSGMNVNRPGAHGLDFLPELCTGSQAHQDSRSEVPQTPMSMCLNLSESYFMEPRVPESIQECQRAPRVQIAHEEDTPVRIAELPFFSAAIPDVSGCSRTSTGRLHPHVGPAEANRREPYLLRHITFPLNYQGTHNLFLKEALNRPDKGNCGICPQFPGYRGRPSGWASRKSAWWPRPTRRWKSTTVSKILRAW